MTYASVSDSRCHVPWDWLSKPTGPTILQGVLQVAMVQTGDLQFMPMLDMSSLLLSPQEG